jgi:PhnB protein
LKVITYLHFDGRCEEAFTYYANVLNGTIEGLFNWEGTPAAEHAPPEMAKKVLHATLNIGDQSLMGCDCPPGTFKTPQGFAVSLNLNDKAKAETIFTGLSKNGSVTMPLEKTFWAERFGMLVDQFGIPWMVNCASA